MTEFYPDTPEHPRFETEVTYPTAFALEEYKADRKVRLADAAYDMASLGLSIVDRKLGGCVIEAHYSKSEQSYTAPEEMDLGLIDRVKRISVPLPQHLQDSIKLMAMRCELSDEQMFASLIEEARLLRIIHKRGGNVIIIHPNGKCEKLAKEDDNQ